jgi:dolichol-phosphate mannosyltransferase
MDADLQDPPELLEQMLAKWREGYHVVYAKRESRRHESALKRGLAYSFYRVLTRLSDVRIPEDTGDFCLMDRVIVDHLNAMPERNRYMRGLRAWLGFRQTAVMFARPPRAAGEPKYTFRKSLSLALSAILGFSKVPLRLGTYLGFVVSGLSFLLALAFIGMRLAGMDVVRGWASTIVLVLFLGGVQLLTLGIIGEYLSRIYDEVKQRPFFVIRRADGFAVETRRESPEDAPLLRLTPRA